MRFRSSVLVVSLWVAGSALAGAPAEHGSLAWNPPPASTQDDGSQLYALVAGSSFQEGCFPPCLCPITNEVPLEGTFRLRSVMPDPLYAVYEVAAADWQILWEAGAEPVTGSGTYRIGGEVALTNELSLDLAVGGEAVEHFDSGIVVGGNTFPEISAVVAMHQMQCWDRVLKIHAMPVGALPTHSVFAVMPSASAVTVSLLTGGSRSELLGSLRLFLGDPAVPVAAVEGLVGVSVDAGDLFAPDFEPELPGLYAPLHLVDDPAVRSTGAWNRLTGEIGFDLYLVAPDGNLPVAMPLRLEGTLDASELKVSGNNGDIPDGSMAVTITAARILPAPGPAMPPPAAD